MGANLRHVELMSRVVDAWRAGQFREVGVLAEMASRHARRRMAGEDMMRATAAAAAGWVACGQVVRALDLIVDVERDASRTGVEPFVLYLVRSTKFAICRDWTPSLARLGAMLGEVEDAAKECGKGHMAAFYGLRASLHGCCGRWEERADDWEMAWVEYRDGSPLCRACIAYSALSACLGTSRESDVGRWREVLRSRAGADECARRKVPLAEVNLALRDSDYDRAAKQFEILEGERGEEQSVSVSTTLQNLGTRVNLLDQECGDPGATGHSARVWMGRRHPGALDRHETYHRLLLLGDFRLACVRFAAGMGPVEDYWHRGSGVERRPGVAYGRSELQCRIERCRRAFYRAMRVARHLDECFETGFRAVTVKEHIARLEEIGGSEQ